MEAILNYNGFNGLNGLYMQDMLHLIPFVKFVIIKVYFRKETKSFPTLQHEFCYAYG